MALRCEPCEMDFNGSIPYQAHMVSQKHEKKVRKIQCENSVESISDPYIKKHQNKYKCDICNITLNSFQQAEMHALGQKHKRLLLKMDPLAKKNYVSSASEVSDYELKTSEESLKFPLTFRFNDITPENVLSDITVFDVNDPVYF